MLKKYAKTKLTVAASLLAIVVGLAIFESRGSETSVAAKATSVQVSAFSATSQGAIPSAVQRNITTGAASEYRPDFSKAVKVSASDDTKVIIVPTADGGACLSLPSGTLTCGSAASIIDGTFNLTMMKQVGKEKIESIVEHKGYTTIKRSGLKDVPTDRYSVVSDDVAAVAALKADGSVIKRVKVSNNVYHLGEAELKDGVSITLFTADGKQSVTAPLIK